MADQAKQLCARGEHRAHRCAARGDDAAVGRQHLGLLHAQLLAVHTGLGRSHAGHGGFFGGDVLNKLLGADHPSGLQATGTLGIGTRFVGRGLGLAQVGLGLGQVGLNGCRMEHRQHLAGLDHIAHIDANFGQTQTTDFAAHAGFLPSGDVAVGLDLHRQGLHAGAAHTHRQGGFGGGWFGCLCPSLAGQQSQAQAERTGGCT